MLDGMQSTDRRTDDGLAAVGHLGLDRAAQDAVRDLVLALVDFG